VKRHGPNTKKAWLALLFAGLALTAPYAQAQSTPSFDCGKATTPVEKLICGDPKLGELDRKMATIFRQALDKAPSADRASIIERQNRWLKARTDACGLDPADPGFRRSVESSPANCVERMYARWLEYTGGQITTPPPRRIEVRFEAKRQPFRPGLLISLDPLLCNDFQNALRKDFLARHRDGESLYKEPPMALGHWMAWPSDLEGLGVDVVEADLEQNGHKQLLIHVAQIVYSHVGYALVIGPDTSTDGLMEEMADSAKSQPGDRRPRRYKNVEPKEWAELNGRGSPVRVLAYRGGLYLYSLHQGVHGYSGDGLATLRRIHADGSTDIRCQASIAPPAGTLPMPWRSNRPDARSVPAETVAWMQTLREIQGDEGRWSGTLHSLSRLIGSSSYTWYDALVRPWEVAVSPSPHQPAATAMRQWIQVWGHQSLSKYRLARRFEATRRAAIDALAAYYERAFGIDNGQEAASAVTDSVISSSFVVHGLYAAGTDHLSPEQAVRYSEWRDWDDTSRRLRSALLVGTTANEVDAMIEDGAIVSGRTTWGTTSPEPALFYALEHPDEVSWLLDRGVDINEGNAFGKTALMYAAHYDLDSTVTLLLASGADVTRRTDARNAGDTNLWFDGRTALMYAAENASARIIAELIRAGSDTCAIDTGQRDVQNYLSRNRRLSDGERARVGELIAQKPCDRSRRN
jgi:uncharacterized protein YecT (DUF1311 family)